MAVQSSPVLPQTPKIAVTQFTTTATATTIANSTTTFTALYTGGTNGSKITSVLATNTSTQAVMDCLLSVGSTVSGAQLYYPLVGVTVPGVTDLTTTLVSYNLFSSTTLPLPVDGDGNPYLFLASTSYTLSVGIGSSIQTTNGRVSFIAIGADF